VVHFGLEFVISLSGWSVGPPRCGSSALVKCRATGLYGEVTNASKCVNLMFTEPGSVWDDATIK
jgi:hypothetical protein